MFYSLLCTHNVNANSSSITKQSFVSISSFSTRNISYSISVYSFMKTIVKENKLFVLDKINENPKSTQVPKKNIRISTTKFSKSVIGKTKDQIKQKYGKPCEAQNVSFYNFWYYGSLYCGKNRIVVFDEDSEKEVSQVQIQFSGDKATAVNYY